MDEKLTIGDRIAYKEQMLKVYEDKLYDESKYRMTIKQEKEKNNRKFKIYLTLTIIFVLVDLLALFIAGGQYLNANPKSDSGMLIVIGMTGITRLVGSILLAFSGIGTVFSVFKLIRYGKRVNKELDTRDFIWRSYDEMLAISKTVTEETVTEKTKMTAELELEREEQRRQTEQLRLDYEAGKEEQETISMSELFYLKETHREELPQKSNPLVKTWED